jgi:hypothetical protein
MGHVSQIGFDDTAALASDAVIRWDPLVPICHEACKGGDIRDEQGRRI